MRELLDGIRSHLAEARAEHDRALSKIQKLEELEALAAELDELDELDGAEAPAPSSQAPAPARRTPTSAGRRPATRTTQRATAKSGQAHTASGASTGGRQVKIDELEPKVLEVLRDSSEPRSCKAVTEQLGLKSGTSASRVKDAMHQLERDKKVRRAGTTRGGGVLWTVVGGDRKPTAIEQRILDAVKDEPLSMGQLLSKVFDPPDNVRAAVDRLVIAKKLDVFPPNGVRQADAYGVAR